MRRAISLVAALVLGAALTASPTWAQGKSKTTTKTTVVKVGERYRGAVAFTTEPQAVLIPETRVYYVSDMDADVYRFGDYWYIAENGAWYRANTWQGPFVRVKTNTVPRTIRTIPAAYRIHWSP
ncbi:MAG TPA: hypothetical protein VFP58_07345 [Candidatus Eisenbacteria bacterium]|nr:hypothetical protein [Candidatus Eisenbacteria bacterium]